MADADKSEKEQLRSIQSFDNNCYKACLEAVGICYSHSPDHPNAVQWQLVPRKTLRCQTVFLGDTRILKGEHLVARDLPKLPTWDGKEESMYSYHMQLHRLLGAEIGEGGLADSARRWKRVTHLFSKASEVAARVHLAAGRLVFRDIQDLEKSVVPEVARAAGQIRSLYMDRFLVKNKPGVDE